MAENQLERHLSFALGMDSWQPVVGSNSQKDLRK
jgi:hypothetical protein